MEKENTSTAKLLVSYFFNETKGPLWHQKNDSNNNKTTYTVIF